MNFIYLFQILLPLSIKHFIFNFILNFMYRPIYVGNKKIVNQEKWVLGSLWNGENPIQILIGRKVSEN